MKRNIIFALLIVVACSSFCFANANLKVRVNVNNQLLVPNNGYPIIEVNGGHKYIGVGGSFYIKKYIGKNPATFNVAKNYYYNITATLPNGTKKEKKILIKSGSGDNLTYTINFTCDASNTIIIKHYLKGTTVPVPATISLVRKQSTGNVLHGKKHTDSQGRVEFNKVWRMYPYYAECRPDSDNFSKVKVDIPPFPSDFMTTTIKAYCTKPGIAPIKRKTGYVPEVPSVPIVPSAP